ncbi:MAG: DUF5104 domain-containing protein [Oscillospiraceae bacterium]|nr:DUF5104 domain-containing protein [Oscillospiraceae bacterium]
MKRKHIVLSVTVGVILISGIVALLWGGYRFARHIDEKLENSQSAVGGRMGLEILHCFNEKDSEGLKEMFCDLIKNTHDLDSEIEEAFAVIDKPIISYRPFQIGGEEYRREGVITKSWISADIQNVKISEEERYDVVFSANLVTGKGDVFIGVDRIAIYDDNDNLICTIGANVL